MIFEQLFLNIEFDFNELDKGGGLFIEQWNVMVHLKYQLFSQ